MYILTVLSCFRETYRGRSENRRTPQDAAPQDTTNTTYTKITNKTANTNKTINNKTANT